MILAETNPAASCTWFEWSLHFFDTWLIKVIWGQTTLQENGSFIRENLTRHPSVFAASKTGLLFNTHMHTHAHTHTLYGPLDFVWVSQYQNQSAFYWSKRSNSSGSSWSISAYGPAAPCPRHITMPAPHHSVFHKPDACRPSNRVRALKANMEPRLESET